MRASVAVASASALDQLALAVAEPIASISVRAWPSEFPDDIAVLRHAPYESRADSVLYCQILAEVARERGWAVNTFDAMTVEQRAVDLLGDRADAVLHGPKELLGPPWVMDHRIALAATIVDTPSA